ncbi:MAG: hypothetical protein WAK20_19725 [Candidatus Acidiferrum sp.]
MNRRVSGSAVRIIGALALALPFGIVAQGPVPERLSGIVNDYTPATGVSEPWEMHGTWSLKLKEESGKGDFTAVMTMEHPDSWIEANPGSPTNPNVDNPATRSPHTHHITMTEATVTYDPRVCPVDSPPTTVRFVVTGPASVTGNGTPAPFEVAKGLSTLQVCITGGTDVRYSNVSMAFAAMSPASGHFGSQAIHGVVRNSRNSTDHDENRR